MPSITITNLAGESRTIKASSGRSLMENIRDHDFDDLAAICGGCCSCCTCHVYVAADGMDKLPERQDDEAFLLEDSPHYKAESSRLSCQIEVTDALDGLSVTIVPEA